MAVISINYEEPNPDKYESVKYNGMGTESKVFDSGDFMKDWYFCLKHRLLLPDEDRNKDPFASYSSSVDHFIMDGAPYDSKYLHFPDSDTEDVYLNDVQEEGIEFFVPKGTSPTWNELREMCGDPKKEVQDV